MHVGMSENTWKVQLQLHALAPIRQEWAPEACPGAALASTPPPSPWLVRSLRAVFPQNLENNTRRQRMAFVFAQDRFAASPNAEPRPVPAPPAIAVCGMDEKVPGLPLHDELKCSHGCSTRRAPHTARVCARILA